MWLKCFAIGLLMVVGNQTMGMAAENDCDTILVDLEGLRKHGPEYDEVVGMMSSLAGWMKDDRRCSGFFGGVEAVEDWIQRLIRYGLIAVAKTTNMVDPEGMIISGFTSSCGARAPAGYAAIFIATNGSFFDRDVRTAMPTGSRWKYYPGASVQVRVILILHELSHSMGLAGFSHDDRLDMNMSAKNNGVLQAECAKTIESAVRMNKSAERRIRGAGSPRRRQPPSMPTSPDRLMRRGLPAYNKKRRYRACEQPKRHEWGNAVRNHLDWLGRTDRLGPAQPPTHRSNGVSPIGTPLRHAGHRDPPL